MASIKIKFRQSSVAGKPGTMFYQIIHNRTVRQRKTGFRLYNHEWDSESRQIVFPITDVARIIYLQQVKERILSDMNKLHSIINRLELTGSDYTSDNIFEEFQKGANDIMFFSYMQGVIDKYRSLGRIRTSEGYKSALNSFIKFCNGTDLPIQMIDSNLINEYELYLRRCKLSPNSSSFYMRNLRAVYNKAVENNHVLQKYPFKHVYTGVEKTIKRAITLNDIKKIIEMDLSDSFTREFARDMFLFSFYTRGMSFVDMAYLKKTDLSNGILTYRRHKTGQFMLIKWEDCMQKLLDKYARPSSEYLLPVLDSCSAAPMRKQYIYASHNINRSLKFIGIKAGLKIPLTMYVARHSWASIANSNNIPISIISQGMGHNSEKTTRIYIALLENNAIDNANEMILNLCGK